MGPQRQALCVECVEESFLQWSLPLGTLNNILDGGHLGLLSHHSKILFTNEINLGQNTDIVAPCRFRDAKGACTNTKTACTYATLYLTDPDSLKHGCLQHYVLHTSREPLISQILDALYLAIFFKAWGGRPFTRGPGTEQKPRPPPPQNSDLTHPARLLRAPRASCGP